MAEEKKAPAPEVLGVSYMMVPNGERIGDALQWVIRRVTFDGKKTASDVLEDIHPASRVVIRDRLRMLNEGREVAR
jgi:hypothetical protein